MIIPEILYVIKCNRCGHIYEGCDGAMYSSKVSDLEENAQENDWQIIENKHFCPCCYDVDENETVTIKQPFPAEVKMIKKFLILNKIVQEFNEKNDCFICKFVDYNNYLNNSAIAFISQQKNTEIDVNNYIQSKSVITITIKK